MAIVAIGAAGWGLIVALAVAMCTAAHRADDNTDQLIARARQRQREELPTLEEAPTVARLRAVSRA